jgi:Putative beta-barrel porin 2
MLCAKSNRIVGLAALAALSALFAFGGVSAARAQAEPPTSIPAGGPAGYDPNAIAFNSWLLYPSINFLAENSNNYFIAPQSKLSGFSYGVSPALTAIWSNGIHTTTLYGNFSQLQYPPDDQVPQESRINSISGEGTWTQQYSPLRDLIFTASADYQHQTLQAGLTSAIPTATGFSGFIVLPNGNIQEPNGTIINPATGQVVGQAGSSASASPTSFFNPYDTFTGTAKVQKLFSYGIVDLSASFGRVVYENTNQGATPSQNYSNKTFGEDAAFWLGSVFYVYSNGSYNFRDTDPSIIPGNNTTAYRIVGGIGTRQFGLFRASAYFGHQGSGTSGAQSSGGNLFGGALTYYPTSAWTVSATIDETINLSPGSAGPSNQAIGIGGITPLQVSTSGSTQTTSTALHASDVIDQQWTATGTFGFVHVENIGSPIWQNSYVADGQLSYQMWRNLTLTGEYQYSGIVSNAPQTSAVRNLITMSATYRF